MSLMKRKYFLHRINAPMDTDHVVYVVWCGESVREQRKLTQLVAWAFREGATLMSWSEDIDFYLQVESERCFPNKGLLDFGFVRTEISVSEALKMAEENSWARYESGLATPKAFFMAIQSSSPARLDRARGVIQSSHVLTSPRKNLSQEDSQMKTVIRFV